MYMCTYVPCFIDTGRYLFTEYSHVFSRSLRALELANGEHAHQPCLGETGLLKSCSIKWYLIQMGLNADFIVIQLDLMELQMTIRSDLI